ncbi:hypothetical protein [Oceanicaulis sp. MMSF_3324]|uniref:hypothetical protein n=1 Tax=Oceanicaulis sp. MMSF_3324 TaxID=3046702 RepID=UPI00273E446D|nr:hypothetical protein [Oceanicaulis sp. MMSF_3324]
MNTRVTITCYQLSQMHGAAKTLSVLLSAAPRSPWRDGALFLTSYMLEGCELAQKKCARASYGFASEG